jgi:hypothetical protein
MNSPDYIKKGLDVPFCEIYFDEVLDYSFLKYKIFCACKFCRHKKFVPKEFFYVFFVDKNMGKDI